VLNVLNIYLTTTETQDVFSGPNMRDGDFNKADLAANIKTFCSGEL